MKFSMFIDDFHKENNVCFNPELPPVFEDEVYDGEAILGARKDEQEDGSYMVPCLPSQNMHFYFVSYSDFEISSKGGKIYNFLTSHFHYYMLLRLMMSLDGGLYLFTWRDDMLRLNMYNLSNVVKWLCFAGVGCLGLACLRLDKLSMLLLSPKLLMAVLSKFRIGYGFEMNQVIIPSCFNFYILILGSDVDISHAKACLKCCHINGMVMSHFTCGINGVLTDYKPTMTCIMQMDSGMNQRVVVAYHGDVYCHLGVEVYAFGLSILDVDTELGSMNQGTSSAENYAKELDELYFICGEFGVPFEERISFYNGLHSKLAKTNNLLDVVWVPQIIENIRRFPRVVIAEFFPLLRVSSRADSTVKRTVTSTILGTVMNATQDSRA